MLSRLDPREKMILAMGLAALAITLFLYWGLFPLLERRERSARQVLARENALREIYTYQDEVERLQHQNRRTTALLARRPDDFSLFSFLDQLAGTAGVKNNIVYMKPSVVQDGETEYRLSRVEIKLDQVTLDQISRFLYHIETSPHLIQVPRLSIKQTQQDSGFLEAVLQVETLET